MIGSLCCCCCVDKLDCIPIEYVGLIEEFYTNTVVFNSYYKNGQALFYFVYGSYNTYVDLEAVRNEVEAYSKSVLDYSEFVSYSSLVISNLVSKYPFSYFFQNEVIYYASRTDYNGNVICPYNKVEEYFHNDTYIGLNPYNSNHYVSNYFYKYVVSYEHATV